MKRYSEVLISAAVGIVLSFGCCFIAGAVSAEDGLSDLRKAREVFLTLTEKNYAPDASVAEDFIRLSEIGRANDVMLLQLYMAVHLPDAEVERIIGLFDWEKGGWKDIDYASKRRARWHPTLHVTRMYALAKLYKAGNERWKGSKELQKLLHGALTLWYDMLPVCPNWWHNEIGVPKKYAAVMLMLRDELSKEEIEGGLKVLDKAKLGRTGQNKMWLAGNNLMRALLVEDEALAQRACRDIKETIFVTEGEGIQPDWSFHQHGPQIQFGNYGLAFVDGVAFWMAILKDTKYDFTKEQKEIMNNLIKEGTSWCVYQGYLDLNFCGRQNFINAGRGKASAFAIAAMYMAMASDDEKDFYTSLANANLVPSMYPNTLVGGRYFWRSDCGIYRRPDWYASVRMHSSRTIGFEFTNNENTLGNFSADGALILMQDAKEFIDIFAYWDWRKIPGVTAYDDGKPMKCDNKDELKKNHSEHVGGLAYDGSMAATMEINRDGLKALKSVFFFDDCIVNLGTDIKGSRDIFNTVTTGIDQTHLSPDGFVNGDIWAYHADRAYLSLDGARMNVTGDLQRGKWDDIEPSFDGRWDEGKVFKCWFDHPMDKVDAGEAGYAYAIFPRTGLKEIKAIAKEWNKKGATKDLKVLSNDGKCQAVLYKGTVCAVMHEPGTYTLGTSTVTAPGPQVYIKSVNGEKVEILPAKAR